MVLSLLSLKIFVSDLPGEMLQDDVFSFQLLKYNNVKKMNRLIELDNPNYKQKYIIKFSRHLTR